MLHAAQVSRPDRIFEPDLIGDQVAEMIYHAMKALDETATSMERTWGVNRLPSLVSAETASKFGSAKAKLDEAIKSNDHELMIKKANVMQKGWLALDREAKTLGAKTLKQLNDESVHVSHPETGQQYVIVKRHGASDIPEGAKEYSFDEVCRALHWFNNQTGGVVERAKELFPGATVEGYRKDTFNDEIPF